MSTITAKKHEFIIWEGKPEFIPYLLLAVWSFAKSLIFLTLICVIFYVLSIQNPENIIDSAILNFIIILGIGLPFFSQLWEILVYKNLKYCITNKRIFIQKDVFKQTLIKIENYKIITVEVEESWLEKKFKTGTILIHSGEYKEEDGGKIKIKYKLNAIREPYSILKLINYDLQLRN